MELMVDSQAYRRRIPECQLEIDGAVPNSRHGVVWFLQAIQHQPHHKGAQSDFENTKAECEIHNITVQINHALQYSTEITSGAVVITHHHEQNGQRNRE